MVTFNRDTTSEEYWPDWNEPEPEQLPTVLPDLGTLHQRPCQVEGCDVVNEVHDRGVDTIGIGMSVDAADRLSLAVRLHMEEHPLEDWLATVAFLSERLLETQQMLADALEMTKTTVAAPPPAGLTNPLVAYQPTIDAAEEELRRSREAQDRYDPVKDTPRYSPNLEEGVVGIRR